LTGRPERLVLNHHSITPPECFASWNNAIARLQTGALQRLEVMAPRAALGIADSEFNAAELRSAGCRNVTVVPVAGISVPPLDPGPELTERIRARQRGPGPHWLSVGRWAPNKAHHDTLAALFVARATTEPGATLTLVGSATEPAYAGALRRYAAALGLCEAVEFAEGISDAELAAHYRCADVLVMLSDHEGFGVPLVEAMGQGTPIVAFDAGAVGEVVDGCGVLLEEKHPRAVAEAVTNLLSDGPRRDRLVVAGRQRFDGLGLDRAANRLVEALERLGAPTGAPP
jgi:glycosyltransferase involved in cell wall biosynthesis